MCFISEKTAGGHNVVKGIFYIINISNLSYLVFWTDSRESIPLTTWKSHKLTEIFLEIKEASTLSISYLSAAILSNSFIVFC